MSEAKLALRKSESHTSVIPLSKHCAVGGRELLVIGGPCCVETWEQMNEAASELAHTTVQALRGGAYKPRTSPYSFQGLGIGGLTILSRVGREHDIPIVTEVMAIEQIPFVEKHASVLQIGSRNMHNFDLLKAVGASSKPVLLKRGLAATIEEFLLAAEYILAHGNPNVILCERGIRSFDNHTRNVLDLGAVVALKQLTHLPVITDPSHAAGKRELIADLARASIAAGADGIMIECHPQPEQSLCDARQALSLLEMQKLVESLRPIALAVGRSLASPTVMPFDAKSAVPINKKRAQERDNVVIAGL